MITGAPLEIDRLSPDGSRESGPMTRKIHFRLLTFVQLSSRLPGVALRRCPASLRSATRWSALRPGLPSDEPLATGASSLSSSSRQDTLGFRPIPQLSLEAARHFPVKDPASLKSLGPAQVRFESSATPQLRRHARREQQLSCWRVMSSGPRASRPLHDDEAGGRRVQMSMR